MQNNFQIGPVILDKKIFKVLTMHIYGKQAPPPGGHVFQRIGNILTILVKGAPRNICAK